MRNPGKKGAMEVGGLYPFMILILLVVVLGAIGTIILSKLVSSSLIAGDSTAIEAVNSSKTEFSNILTVWLPLIILVVIASILIVVLVRNMAGRLGGGR